MLFRYVDALLMKAEAKVRNGEDGSAELDAVRLRVGMPVCEASLENILRARLLELVGKVGGVKTSFASVSSLGL